ncbi:MAG TPA: hypothetical protein VEF76_13785 [Patescibacteria group bacterium]|nr:hypothetical protein [Patescibacteria group bacterium]
MIDDQLTKRLVKLLHRDLLVDLYAVTVARAREAYEIIEDTPLEGKSARAAEGQIRFRLLEQAFQKTCEQYGAAVRESGVIEGTDLRFFQPLARFAEADEAGVVLGMASMPGKGEMPSKNQSRLSGASMNYHITPRLALDKSDPRPGDIYVLFLVARDRAEAGAIQEVAIGIIGPEYENFVFYEALDEFWARYVTADKAEDVSPAPKEKLVKLKTKPNIYKPPGQDGKKDKKEDGSSS